MFGSANIRLCADGEPYSFLLPDKRSVHEVVLEHSSIAEQRYLVNHDDIFVARILGTFII